MENRKQFENSDKDEYNRLNKQINSACKEPKEKWPINQWKEVEQLEKQYKSREMQNKVREVTSKNTKKKASGCIKDKNGNILYDQEELIPHHLTLDGYLVFWTLSTSTYTLTFLPTFTVILSTL